MKHPWPRWALLLAFIVTSLPTGCRDRPAPPTAASPNASAEPWPSEQSAPKRWVVDGDPGEWDQGANVARRRDNAGDAAGPLDVVALAATVRGHRLLIRLDIASVANLYSGPRDGGSATLEVASGDDRLELDLRQRRLSRAGERIRLSDAGLWVAPAHAAKTFELAFDLKALGWKPGAPLKVSLTEGDQVGPVELKVPPEEAASAGPVDLTKPPDGLRIASFNTLEHGLLDLDRGEAQRRLLAAVQPDVVLLQELGPVKAEQAARALGLPHAVSKPLNRIVGHAIVSSHPLVELQDTGDRFVAAFVKAPTPVVAVSVHLSCCGYLGSDQDERRLAQARQLASFIRSVREGSVPGCPASTPVIVAGDFNDVGSPGLRTEVAAAQVRRIPLAHPRWGSAHTWGTRGAKYPASVLDLMFASPDADWRQGFILDTAELTDEELKRFDLQRADSRSSDHRVLVADFRPRN